MGDLNGYSVAHLSPWQPSGFPRPLALYDGPDPNQATLFDLAVQDSKRPGGRTPSTETDMALDGPNVVLRLHSGAGDLMSACTRKVTNRVTLFINIKRVYTK